MSRIAQHVSECAANLERCLQDVRVVAIGEDFATAIPEAIQRASDADAEALDPATERLLVSDFTHEMQVIRHHGELDDAHLEAVRAFEQRRSNQMEGPALAQTFEATFQS